MNFTVLTIFPELIAPFAASGIVGKAVEEGRIGLDAINIRDFTSDRHRTTDDRPYGGGCGMVMKPEPLSASIRHARAMAPEASTVLLSPQGRRFDQHTAAQLAELEGLILICGRYEGVDERVCTEQVDLEISIGDYVLTGGEIGAMVIIDAVTRLIPGALGGEDSAADDSFATGLLEHAHYTRPPVFENQAVPQVLTSGHHGDIAKWRLESALIRTMLKRSDLLKERALAPDEMAILEQWRGELDAIIQSQG